MTTRITQVNGQTQAEQLIEADVRNAIRRVRSVEASMAAAKQLESLRNRVTPASSAISGGNVDGVSGAAAADGSYRRAWS